VGRRLLVVLLLALVASATAATAHALGADDWWTSHIGADPAQAPGPGVPIVIVDSGVDATHPEFAGRADTTYLNDQSTTGGGDWHGTAVASTALSVYPRAALEIWDISPGGELSVPAAVAAITATAQHCPRVISLSFEAATRDASLADAIETAQHNGCLVVASAGNGGAAAANVYPASLPHVVSVGSTDENDAVASFSSISQSLDVVAPGVDILSAVPTWRRPSGYETENGTSFSAPLVSAAAAWLWTVRPTLTAFQVAAILRSTAHDINFPGFDNSSGYGLVNLPAALAAPAPALDPAEPNDDIDEVKPGALFPEGEPALTTASKPSLRTAGTLDMSDDPRDLYRIWVPARKVVHVSVSGGPAAARIWGPQTGAVMEGLKARRRDLRGPAMAGGKNGSAAYVEVLLTGRSNTASYVLNVTVAKH
jgi:subtilisin family serine protease